MRTITYTKLALAAALVAAPLLLKADDDDWRYRDRRDRGSYRGYGYRGDSYGLDRSPVDRILRDVEMVASRSRVDGHEANHFRRVIQELNEFRSNSYRGHFDRGKLDSAIDNLNDLARADQIHPRYRETLRRDLDDLRRLRSGGPGRGW